LFLFLLLSFAVFNPSVIQIRKKISNITESLANEHVRQFFELNTV